MTNETRPKHACANRTESFEPARKVAPSPGAQEALELDSLVPSTLIEIPCRLVNAIGSQAEICGEAVEERIARILDAVLQEKVRTRSDSRLPAFDVDELLSRGGLEPPSAR